MAPVYNPAADPPTFLVTDHHAATGKIAASAAVPPINDTLSTTATAAPGGAAATAPPPQQVPQDEYLQDLLLSSTLGGWDPAHLESDAALLASELAASPRNPVRIRRLLERRVNAQPTAADGWLAWIQYELAENQLEQVTTLHQRAVSAVTDPPAFMAAYNALKA